LKHWKIIVGLALLGQAVCFGWLASLAVIGARQKTEVIVERSAPFNELMETLRDVIELENEIYEMLIEAAGYLGEPTEGEWDAITTKDH